ncbi:MAG: DNA cytosine methyltransferase [Firmicutes bacterium]|nr:DNA cytosine methyltransferase [Bacillota bacterium]
MAISSPRASRSDGTHQPYEPKDPRANLPWSSVAEPGLPAISLFSGVGGLDLGIEWAGFRVRVAVEWDADAAESLRRNNPDRPVLQRDIRSTSTDEILAAAGLRPAEPALVVGGPPCTPFSKSGYWLEYKRLGLDPDRALLDEFLRVVVEARPEAVLMENVHGLAYRNRNAAEFTRLVTGLQDAGYSVRWKVLNAADYGVPQLRKRLFLYATREGTPPNFPQPTHSGWSETRRRFDERLRPYVTSREAIGDLEARDDLAEPEERVEGKYGDLLREIPPGDNYLFFTAERGHPNPLFRWRSRYWTFLLKLDPNRPSTTVQAQPGPFVGPFHWQSRRLRALEVKRLQTFPDDYDVCGNRRSLQVQIGNAVPPLLAAIVARPLWNRLRGSEDALGRVEGAQLTLGLNA